MDFITLKRHSLSYLFSSYFSLSLSLFQETVIVGSEIHGLKVKHLHVGGVLGSGEVKSGIRGCIQVCLIYLKIPNLLQLYMIRIGNVH